MPPKRSATSPAKKATSAAAGKRAKKAIPSSHFDKVNALHTELQNLPPPPSIESLDLKEEIRQVIEMADDDVKTAIESVMLDIATSILAEKGFSYDIPMRTTKNQLYVKELDRIVLKSAAAERPFGNVKTVRKTTIMTRVLEFIHQAVSKGIHITKRDLFYSDAKLFHKQEESDGVLDDVACMVGCTRTSLNVVASDKGVVVGRVQFLEDGDPIDCTRMGVGGKAIPSLVDKITDIKSDAKFVLLVEKDAAFMRLAEDRFYNQYPCIIITGKGQPDLSTRLFLKLLKNKLNIPILGVFDSDPYGLKIMSVYMSSSKAMSYDSAALATSDIKWLGVRPSDLDKYKIPLQCRLDMSKEDIAMGEKLLEEDFIKKNPLWVDELKLMLRTKQKAEIQALSSFGFQYLTEEYLPAKLKSGDWI
eukprot:m.126220 g.126220  ORF g.126220 m.126220 type:complete len:418 (-) comp29188_c0_seq1:137-1390(-)